MESWHGSWAILGLSRAAHAGGLNSLHSEQIITTRDGQADAILGDDHTQLFAGGAVARSRRMKPDRIIAEVYRAKDQFAREIGNDVGRLFERLRQDAKKHPQRMAKLVPRPIAQRNARTANRKTAK
jgi:hypothetical protein